MYNVVFEYNQKAGLYSGIRTWTSYQSKQEYLTQHLPSPDDIQNVIAEGVTEDEAENLFLQSPEISYLLVAIQEMCSGQDETVNLEQAKTEIWNTMRAIEYQRSRRREKGLPTNQNIPIFEIGEEDTEKNHLLRGIKKTYFGSPNSSVGFLSIAELLFEVELVFIAIKRLDTLQPSS